MKHYKVNELQKCCFCNADAEIAVMENPITGNIKFFANCTNSECVLNRHYNSKEEAIKAWNNRSNETYCGQ